MALISGFDGSVTLPSMHGGKAYKWNIRSSMANKDVSGYGDGRPSVFRGGMMTHTGQIGFFLLDGTAGAVNLTAPSIGGVTLTLMSKTGCAHSGTALFTDTGINHDQHDPAVEGTYDIKFTGTVSEAWA